MTIEPMKIRALLRKDVKNDLRNTTVLLYLVLPLFFTILYKSIFSDTEGMPSSFVLVIGILMNICMFPISGTAMFIAEEKEKNTLRTLMLSNVSAAEFLLSKALVSYVLTEAIGVGIYLITNADVSLPWFLLITSLAAICLMLLGAVVGIVSKNQMSTGIIASPLMLIMLMPPIFAQISESIAKIAQFVPTNALIELMVGTERTAFHLTVLISWIVVSCALFAVVYRRKRLD